jgi:hypothetical protein
VKFDADFTAFGHRFQRFESGSARAPPPHPIGAVCTEGGRKAPAHGKKKKRAQILVHNRFILCIIEVFYIYFNSFIAWTADRAAGPLHRAKRSYF